MELMTALQTVADPSHSALLIVDPQHDFCSKTGAIATRFGLDMKEINEAVPQLNGFIELCRKKNIFVIWIREVFSDRRMHANQKALWGGGEDIWLIPEGGKGCEWFEGMIAPLPQEPVVTKWQYDGFEDTELDLLLRSRGIKTLLMTGFTSNVCVETTARRGYMKGYHIVLVSDCAAATTPAEHEAAVHNIRTYFGHVTTSRQMEGLWSAVPKSVEEKVRLHVMAPT